MSEKTAAADLRARVANLERQLLGAQMDRDDAREQAKQAQAVVAAAQAVVNRVKSAPDAWLHDDTRALIAAVDAVPATAGADGQTTTTCGHQHARLLRQPGDRPILCALPADHDGDHGEPETGSHWDRNSFFGNVATSDPRRVERTTCGHTYIGNVGEFSCTLYAPHGGKHWNALAEFWWDAAAPVSAVPATDYTGHGDGAA